MGLASDHAILDQWLLSGSDLVDSSCFLQASEAVGRIGLPLHRQPGEGAKMTNIPRTDLPPGLTDFYTHRN